MSPCLYKNKNPLSKKMYPYLIDVQSPLLSSLETRLVIPVLIKDNFRDLVITHLNPVIKIRHEEYVVLTQQMAAIPKHNLGAAIQAENLDRNELLAAVDFLLTGI